MTVTKEMTERCAKLCDLIANRPVQGPESGAWERAERHTAKRLAADIRAIKDVQDFSDEVGIPQRIAEALERCDWAGCSIGNKEILRAAVVELRSLSSRSAEAGKPVVKLVAAARKAQERMLVEGYRIAELDEAIAAFDGGADV